MQDFTPARFLESGHLQTVWPALFRRARPRVEHVCVPCPDHEPLSLALLPHVQGAPGVLVLHGLEGSSDAPYAAGLLARIGAAGWNGAALNFRSCAPRRLGIDEGRTLYHAGRTEEIALVCGWLSRRWNGKPLGAVGVSLGGNMLLKWLGETGDDCPLRAAVAVSVPFDLRACAARVDAPGFWAGVYRRRFLRSLKGKALRLARRDPQRLEEPVVRACRSFAAYDEHVTARLFGFAGAEDYWTRVSATRFLAGIRRPTLLIAALDDPFVPPEALPREAIAANPHLSSFITPRGGHVGFIAGSIFRPRYVVDEIALAHLAPALTGATAPRSPGTSTRPL